MPCSLSTLRPNLCGGGNKNKLSEDNREKIFEAYVARRENDHFSRLVPNSEIAKNDYNIAVSSYVEQDNDVEEVDIKKLNAQITEIVTRQQELREVIDEIVADLEGGAA